MAWEVARPVCANKGESWGSRAAVAELLHLARPQGTREPGPRCGGTHSGSGLPQTPVAARPARQLWRRGLALQPSAVHLPSSDPCRSPGPSTIPCPPASPHYLGGDQGQRFSRQRALRGRRHARAPGPASGRDGIRPTPAGSGTPLHPTAPPASSSVVRRRGP